jgi:hypothetical protein
MQVVESFVSDICSASKCVLTTQFLNTCMDVIGLYGNMSLVFRHSKNNWSLKLKFNFSFPVQGSTIFLDDRIQQLLATKRTPDLSHNYNKIWGPKIFLKHWIENWWMEHLGEPVVMFSSLLLPRFFTNYIFKSFFQRISIFKNILS